MAPKMITDCTLDDLEGALAIRYGSKLHCEEATMSSRRYRIGRIYKLKAEVHRKSHLQVSLRFRKWFMIVLGLLILWGLLVLVVPGLLGIAVLIAVFAWWLPRKTKKLTAELEESVRKKQEQDAKAPREEPSVIVKRTDAVQESEVVIRKGEVPMKHCIKCGGRIRTEALRCVHCDADLA